MKSSNSIVIIPTYNELENIENLIRAIMQLPKEFDLLIVDDASPDGTADIARNMQQIFPNRINILSREKKLGLGTAYIAGFKWALKCNYDYIFEMDADFSHNPKDLVRLYETCSSGEADLAIGSRYISGINVVNWPMSRVLMSYVASKYVRFITGMNIADTTAGFKCYKNSVLKSINFDNIRFKGYAFQIEMKFKSYKKGFKLKEVPIIFINRVKGTSKMDSSIFGEAFFGVIKLKLDSIFNKKEYK